MTKKHQILTKEIIENEEGFKILSIGERQNFILDNHDFEFAEMLEFDNEIRPYFYTKIKIKCKGCKYITTVSTYSGTLDEIDGE